MFTPLNVNHSESGRLWQITCERRGETGAHPFKGQAQIGYNHASSGEVKQQTWMTVSPPPANIPEKSRRRIRGFLITAVQWEKLCSVPLRSGGWKRALYKLSGHVGARPAEVSCKRKPLKAEHFDVPGSNLTLSRYSCIREQLNLVRERKACSFLLCHHDKKYFFGWLSSGRVAWKCNECSIRSAGVVLKALRISDSSTAQWHLISQ